MRRLIAAILLCCSLVAAQDAIPSGRQPSSKWKRALFRISQIALASGNAADAYTSWGRQEINPSLGRGRFGGRQIAIKSAIVGGVMLSQEFLVRKAPPLRPAFAVTNFGLAGYLGWQAKQNLNFPKLDSSPSPPAQSISSIR